MRYVVLAGKSVAFYSVLIVGGTTQRRTVVNLACSARIDDEMTLGDFQRSYDFGHFVSVGDDLTLRVGYAEIFGSVFNFANVDDAL